MNLPFIHYLISVVNDYFAAAQRLVHRLVMAYVRPCYRQCCYGEAASGRSYRWDYFLSMSKTVVLNFGLLH